MLYFIKSKTPPVKLYNLGIIILHMTKKKIVQLNVRMPQIKMHPDFRGGSKYTF